MSSGDPAMKCTVVAFEQDPNRLGPWSRFVAAIPCGADSSFHYSKLPEGQYLVFAMPSTNNAQTDDRAWLDAHRGNATKVSLSDGVKQDISLRMVMR